MNPSTVLKQADEVVFRKIEEEYLLMPLASTGDDVDSLYNLNPTGGAIWEKIDGKKTLGDIVDELHAEYDRDRETIESEVMAFVHEVEAAGLLKIAR